MNSVGDEAAATFEWTQLSQQCRFAIVSVCSAELGALYSNFAGNNREWSLRFVNSIIASCGLTPQVRTSCDRIFAGEGEVDVQSFLGVICKHERYANNTEKLIVDLLLFGIKEGRYDARLRCLLLKIAFRLHLAEYSLESVEAGAVEFLKDGTGQETKEQEEERRLRDKKRKRKKVFMIGLAAVGGAALLGVTGGLAAPLVAAGAAAVVGGGGAAILGSTAGVAIITALFGTAGAGLTGYKMNRRFGEVTEFGFGEVGEVRPSLSPVVVVTGWLTADEEHDLYTEPWLCLRESPEVYTVRWESNELRKLGTGLASFVKSTAISYAAVETLKQTVLSTLIAAFAWPATLLSVADVIDSPWHVCLNRAEAAGALLADALITGKQGQRPVSLVGYSLGARVIFYALKELARQKDSSGIVENVVLLGAPVSAEADVWRPLLEKVISGKCIIGYCQRDWVLKFLHRTASVSSVVGLEPVPIQHSRMLNFNLSDVVSGHLDYPKALPVVLQTVGLRVDEVLLEKAKTAVSETDALMKESCGESSCLPTYSTDEELRSLQQLIPAAVLLDRQRLPLLGLGTYSASQSPEEVADGVRLALLRGYRHFDCAPLYKTETAIGRIFGDLRSVHAGLCREQLFVTSKLWNTNHHPSRVRDACLHSLHALQLNYLDLYLIHSPGAMQFTDLDLTVSVPRDENGAILFDEETTLLDTWRAMEELVSDGLVRTIGVSNFTIRQLEALLQEARIQPAVNQIEVHPYLTQDTLVDWCLQHRIAVVAFSSLGSQTGELNILDDGTIADLAEEVCFSPAQVCLRWATQRGISVIPHTTRLSELEQNIDSFQLTLSPEQMEAVSALDCGRRTLKRDWLQWDG